MKNLRLSVCLIGLWFMLLAGCSTNNQHGKPFTLSSGRVIRVLAMAPLHYTNGNPPSLMFQYETNLKIADMQELTKEADDIWGTLRFDAERGNFTSGIVSAREIPSGLIFKSSKGFNFVYEKGSDSVWHRLESNTGQKQQ
jgi:hypothetical protein